MYCHNEACVAQVSQHSCYCQTCFEKTWEQEELLMTVLPDCLINLVFEYCDGERFCNVTLTNLRPFLKHLPLTAIKDAMSTNQDVTFLFYMAERYCFSKVVWSGLYEGNRLWRFLLLQLPELVQILSRAHECKFDTELFHACSDPNILHWFLTKNHFAQEWAQSYCETDGIRTIIQRIVSWNSSKLLGWMIDHGLFTKKDTACKALHLMTNNANFFEKVFAIHFQEFDPKMHAEYVQNAIRARNILLLDFLIQLPKFVFCDATIGVLIRDANSNSILCEWIAKKKLVQKDWIDDSSMFFFYFSCKLFEGLLNQGGLDHIPNATLDRFFSRRISYWVQHEKALFFKILPRIHLLETNSLQFLHFVISSWDLHDLHKLVQYPCARVHVTFANLRKANKAFLTMLCCRNRSMEMLEWIATWRDHEQQTLDLRDVYAKNKIFLRYTQTNSDLWIWFQRFVATRRSLKV